jgi:hypothetical protein
MMNSARSIRFWIAAVLLAVAATEAPARQDAGKKPSELQKAQTALEQSAVQAAQAMLKVFKDDRVAMVDLRPSADNPAAAASAPTLQNFLLQVFLREGVLVFPYEQEHKLDVKYKDGKLPKGPLLGADDLKSLGEKKVKYALVPALVVKDSGSTVTLDAYDLEKVQVALQTGVGPIPTKKYPLADLCSAEILPPLNLKVISFAAAHFGQQVDRGECWDVPANPIRANGGRVDGYNFGKEIKWEDGRAGDVITFGTSGETGGHVVVLFRWTKNKAEATILHQNVNNVRKVMFGNLGSVETNKAGQKFALWRPQK